MNTFIKKWKNVSVEDDGAYMSKEATSFCRALNNMLKREGAKRGFEVVAFSKGHYDVSGFVKNGEKFVYFSYYIPRYGARINFNARDCHNGCLVRYAKNEKDYKGGQNNFCSLENLPDALEKMLK